MFAWVSCTPFGKPVVPEVYCMLMTSPASSDACRPRNSSPETSSPLSRNPPKPITGSPSGEAPPMRTTFFKNGKSSKDSSPPSAPTSLGDGVLQNMEKISIPDPFRQEQGCGVGLL